MNTRKLITLSVLLVFLIAAAGCAHVKNDPNVPNPPTITAFEQVMVYNTSLAELNKAVAKGVIATQQNGILTAQQAKPILEYQFKVAAIDKKLTQILQSGEQAAKGRGPEIRQLLTQINDASDVLLKSGNLNVKTDASVTEIQNNVSSIAALGKSIASTLELLGVLKSAPAPEVPSGK